MVLRYSMILLEGTTKHIRFWVYMYYIQLYGIKMKFDHNQYDFRKIIKLCFSLQVKHVLEETHKSSVFYKKDNQIDKLTSCSESDISLNKFL